jgi:hypothetical protein
LRVTVAEFVYATVLVSVFSQRVQVLTAAPQDVGTKRQARRTA